MQQTLTTALELHQAGKLSAAAQVYQQVLTGDPDNAEALHLLGVLRHQQGDPRQAVELIGRAIALHPNIAAFHANLAEVYRAQGQFERAVGCCRTALRLAADYPEALNNLGLALQGLNRHAEAVEPLRRAIALQPDFAPAHNNLALSLRVLQQLDEAVEHFGRAVAIQPDFAAAHTNLGQMLLDRGQAADALPHCQEAVRLDPDRAALHHNLGNALRALDRPVDAKAAFLEALRLDPNLAPSHAHLGLVLQGEGKLADALVWLQQAAALAPDDPTYWEYLAELHDDSEDGPEMVACWERVVVLAPERAAAQRALGWALQREERAQEAGEHYRTALRLTPDAAASHLQMGGWHEERGELAEAESCFRAAIGLQARFALPHARLATLLRGRLPDADLAALEQLHADPALGQGLQARLLFALAHVLDARGSYGRAADCVRQANALTVAVDRPKRPYVPLDHERFVDAVVSNFGPEFAARVAGGGLPTRRPVFVFGLPRSGTTLIEQILASHSRVHGAGEVRLVRRSFDAIPELVGRRGVPMESVPLLDAASVRALAERHDAQLQERGGPAQRVVDKMPDNYMYVGFLAALFPQATLIHCRRNLRDVAVSCWFTDFRSICWANELDHIAGRFKQYVRLMAHWRATLPVPMIEVDYEETVADVESVARRLLAACGLDWEPACLEFHRTQRPVRTASLTQVRRPIYKDSVARWKHYERELAELFAALPSNG